MVTNLRGLLAGGVVILGTALGSHTAGAVDINGGLSWGGWNAVGNSLQTGIWAAGPSTTRSYDIYSTVFTFNNDPITGSPTQVKNANAPAGFASGAYSNGAFAVGHRILGIGLDMNGSADADGSTFISFGLAAGRFQAASSVGASDGKASLSTWGLSRDFSIWMAPANGPSQLSVLNSNGTSQGGAGTASSLPSGTGSGTNFDYAFREFRQGSVGGTVQMFFDLTAMQSLYGSSGSLSGSTALTGVGTSPCSGGGWPCGNWSPSAQAIGGFGDVISIALTNLDTNSENRVAFDVPLARAIPAPGALALFGLGLGVLLCVRRPRVQPDLAGEVATRA